MPPELAKRLLARQRDAVADALNLVDDARPQRRREALALQDTLEREGAFPGASRVGITGIPGVGKSTLLDALVRRLRARGESVGIVAVDPSSPRSGGALLGDRLRVRSVASDPGVFVRSMAARERLGGLADATRASVLILASVFDHVFVETVGVGQSESDVRTVVDTLCYVLQPGAGDTLQFMKAGLLELPDLFAVNKVDLGAIAERTASELSAGLGLGEGGDAGWAPPVVRVSARDGTGIEELLGTIDAHRAHLGAGGALAARRRSGCDAFVLGALERRFGSYGLERLGGRSAVARRLREEREPPPTSARLETLAGEIERALREAG